MDLHQNARLTFRCREALARKILIERLTLNVSVRRWPSGQVIAGEPFLRSGHFG